MYVKQKNKQKENKKIISVTEEKKYNSVKVCGV